MARGPTHVFVSYSHEDEPFRHALEQHLAPLVRRKVITYWDDRAIDAGQEWRAEIMENLARAKVVILLLSSAFVASDFCYKKEMEEAIRRRKRGEVEIIGVMVRQFHKKALPVTAYQLLPAEARPIAEQPHPDAAWTQVADGVEKVVKRLRAAAPKPPPKTKQATRPSPAPAMTGSTIHNLPDRNHHFTGRVELLAHIRASLANGREVALTALNGLGGIGKSQTALQYAWLNHADYCVVWWIKAERLETMLNDLAMLGAKLGFAQSDDLAGAARATLAALSGQTGWLLVYDNVVSEGDIAEWLPSQGGHVILTSRHAVWHKAASINVTTLTEAEAVAFLLERTEDTNTEAAKDLATELGRLPLALEQAAAFMVENAWTLRRYLETFRTRRADLLKLGKPQHYHAETETIATTWALAFEAVEKASPAAAQLLILCAHLAPDDIPLDLLRVGADKLPEPLASTLADVLTTAEAVRVLRGYSLVAVKDDSLSIHRLVQEIVRDRLGEDGRKQWAEWAVECVWKAFPFDQDDLATWPPSTRLLPHAEAAAAHTVGEDVAGKVTANLLGHAGRHLNRQGLYHREVELSRQTLALAERHWPADSPEVGRFTNDLADVLLYLAEFAEAIELFRKSLSIKETAFGPDHPDVAIGAGNLGRALSESGDAAGAREFLERALRIGEAAHGQNHPIISIICTNLGSVLRKLGDLPGAQALFERSLAVAELAYSPDHPNIATCANNLGIVLEDQGDLAGSRTLAERVLQIRERAFGPEHPHIAIAHNNLGISLYKQNDFIGAQEHLSQAVTIGTSTLGTNHPRTENFKKNLAKVEAEIAEQNGA